MRSKTDEVCGKTSEKGQRSQVTSGVEERKKLVAEENSYCSKEPGIRGRGDQGKDFYSRGRDISGGKRSMGSHSPHTLGKKGGGGKKG